MNRFVSIGNRQYFHQQVSCHAWPTRRAVSRCDQRVEADKKEVLNELE
jgi:hypothetical protein